MPLRQRTCREMYPRVDVRLTGIGCLEGQKCRLKRIVCTEILWCIRSLDGELTFPRMLMKNKTDRGTSFNPSRWESPSKEMKDAWMPFGGGARGMAYMSRPNFPLTKRQSVLDCIWPRWSFALRLRNSSGHIQMPKFRLWMGLVTRI